MLKQTAQAFGFSSILLLLNYVDLTSSSGDVRLHWPRSMRSIAFANLLDIFIVAAVFLGVLALSRKSSWWRPLRLVFAAVLPPLLIARNIPLMPFPIPGWGLFVVSAAWIILLVIIWTRSRDFYDGVTKFCGTVLAGFAIFALVMGSQLVRSMVWQPGPQEIFAATRSPDPSPDRPLVVWMVYDELSYDQLFEHRDPALAMPNFDKLRGMSTVYSNVQPIAYKTAQIIPSLLLGERVTDLSYSWSNRLNIRTEQHPEWREFDAEHTLFRTAKQNGFSTAAIGWYLPYCPLLGGVLDECFWTNADALDSEMTPDASLLQNTLAPLRLLTKQLVVPKRADAESVEIEARAHWISYNDLQSRARHLLTRDDTDFVLLHLPIPHPPGMYSYSQHDFSSTGDYLGSLTLTDNSLGELMAILQSSPRWKSTTVIAMGDHSWRIGMWSSRPGWSERDEKASRGQFDPRPALLIHRAGQDRSEIRDELYPMLHLYGSLNCLLQSVRNQDCFSKAEAAN